MKNVIIKGYAGAFHRDDLVVSAIDYDRLQSLVTELEKDKARLDWLQNNFHICRTTDVALSDGFQAWEFYIPSGDGWTDLRAAIDKAIQ